MFKLFHVSLFVLLLFVVRAEEESNVVSKLGTRLRKAKAVMDTIRARRQTERGLQQVACRETEGCTCTGDYIFSATETCALVTKEVTEVDGNLLSRGDCAYAFAVHAIDCGTCESQADRIEHDKSTEQDTTSATCYQMPEGDSYAQLDVTQESKTTGGYTECKQKIAVTDCRGPTPPPTTPRQQRIDTYEGHWELVGMRASMAFSVSSSFSSTETVSQSEDFSNGWNAEATVHFGYHAGSTAGGVVTYGEASAGVTNDWAASTKQVVAQTNTQGKTMSCSVSCPSDSNVYMYFMRGYSAKDPDYYADVPVNCQFECIKQGTNAPKCPPGYCDAVEGQCDCCWSLDWAADPTDSKLPPICPPAEEAAATAGDGTGAEHGGSFVYRASVKTETPTTMIDGAEALSTGAWAGIAAALVACVVLGGVAGHFLLKRYAF